MHGFEAHAQVLKVLIHNLIQILLHGMYGVCFSYNQDMLYKDF